MQVIYNGPSKSVNVEPYGKHERGEKKNYPADFAKDLIATSKRQQFRIVRTAKKTAPPEAPEPKPEG